MDNTNAAHGNLAYWVQRNHSTGRSRAAASNFMNPQGSIAAFKSPLKNGPGASTASRSRLDRSAPLDKTTKGQAGRCCNSQPSSAGSLGTRRREIVRSLGCTSEVSREYQLSLSGSRKKSTGRLKCWSSWLTEQNRNETQHEEVDLGTFPVQMNDVTMYMATHDDMGHHDAFSRNCQLFVRHFLAHFHIPMPDNLMPVETALAECELCAAALGAVGVSFLLGL
ncbi:uncharacterized protein LOC142588053 [Dermacentor variabilis]|uniref:uncharacterized protein LOC142588053 n=1 Tax=Dermacentor variabilis TaxID=34621 RepID=UPI003F5B8C9E